MKIIFTLAILLFTNHFSAAQPEKRHTLGVAKGMVYMSDDKHFDPGLQLEYAYNFQLGKIPLSTGSSLEMIFGDERHMGIALSVGYSPWKSLELGVGPGVMLEGDQHYYCIHTTGAYGFDMGKFSMGPVVELAHTGRHYHFLLGIHFDLDF